MGLNNGEEWRPVSGFDSFYEVSNLGRVRRVSPQKNKTRGGLLKPYPTRGGYLLVDLQCGELRSTVTVHKIAARAFLGPRPEGRPQVDHLNGNKKDNRVANLEYVDQSTNIRRAVARGRSGCLTVEQAREVKARRLAGEGVAALAREFGIHRNTVYLVASGKTFKGEPRGS